MPIRRSGSMLEARVVSGMRPSNNKTMGDYWSVFEKKTNPRRRVTSENDVTSHHRQSGWDTEQGQSPA